MMASETSYIVIPSLQVEYANIKAGSLSYGFPTVSSFLGAMHALQRNINETHDHIHLSGIMIGVHHVSPLMVENQYKVKSFIQKRHPNEKDKKDGLYKSPPINEKALGHLELSLVIELKGKTNATELLPEVAKQLGVIRIAGGAIVDHGELALVNESGLVQAIRELLPVHVLLDATDDLNEILEQLQERQPESDRLDALIHACTVEHQPTDAGWWLERSPKYGRGWLTPIQIGYQAISPRYAPGLIQHTRNNQRPCVFVEDVYTLGKWIFPLTPNPDSLFWRYADNTDENLFIAYQNRE